MKYYSILRPVAPGTYPKYPANKPTEIVNFPDRTYVEEIDRNAWGFLEYPELLPAHDLDEYDLIPSNVLAAEWIETKEAYRICDPAHPEQTLAYDEDLTQAQDYVERNGFRTVELLNDKREENALAILEYAHKILTDAGCDEFTYWGEQSKHLVDDLKTAYPNGMKYPYIHVANAILSISRPKPIVRAKYRVFWDAHDTCDAIDAQTLGEAMDIVMELYESWIDEEQMKWKTSEPTPAEKENWNEMIYACSAIVEKYDPETDEYFDEWYPSDEELEAIGWIELPE